MSVLINGLPAARNGDMGLAVWCGGYFPIFEVMTGSSHVFIGGSRAARQVMDVTYHCLPDPFGGKWGLGKLDIAMAVFGVGMSALGLAAAMEQESAADDRAEKAQVIASESASDDQAAADATICRRLSRRRRSRNGDCRRAACRRCRRDCDGLADGQRPRSRFPVRDDHDGQSECFDRRFPDAGLDDDSQRFGKNAQTADSPHSTENARRQIAAGDVRSDRASG